MIDSTAMMRHSERPFAGLALGLLAVSLLAGCGIHVGSASPTATATLIPTPSLGTGTQWKSPPPTTIDTTRHFTADLKTSKGVFTIQLLPQVAPITVNNFVFLARHHFYDNNIFHRIISTFMIQTGDPTGTGLGGPGYKFHDERVTMKYTPGTVAMANSGPNTNGSQFFVVVGPDGLKLSPSFTIFGRVIRGMNVVYKIANTPVTSNPSGELSQPLTKIVLKRVTIHESP